MHIYQKFPKLISIASILAVSACAVPDWLGAGESKPKLAGERFEVMAIESKLRVDDAAAAESVDTPPAQAKLVGNDGNYAISGKLDSIKKMSIGEAAEEFFNITSAPIFAEGKIFVDDGASNVSALDANLNKLWTTQIVSEDDEKQNLPGGIAYKNGMIFVTTGFGKVAAISAADGKIIWEKTMLVPMRNAPAVDSSADSDKIFISSADNKTFALSAKTGELIWRHSGIAETTRKFATASPAVKNDIVASAYASGEIFGINATQGREVWSELLSGGQSQTKVAASINDVSATPLIVDGIVYATNAGGKLVAMNFGNGARIWEQPISGMATPWVAGSYLFIINDRAELVALNRFDGRVKWVKPLSKPEEVSGKKRVKWQGPVMVGGQLLAHNNFGEMILVDANSGDTISRKEIPEYVYTPASVIDGKVYVITRDADLVEIR